MASNFTRNQRAVLALLREDEGAHIYDNHGWEWRIRFSDLTTRGLDGRVVHSLIRRQVLRSTGPNGWRPDPSVQV